MQRSTVAVTLSLFRNDGYLDVSTAAPFSLPTNIMPQIAATICHEKLFGIENRLARLFRTNGEEIITSSVVSQNESLIVSSGENFVPIDIYSKIPSDVQNNQGMKEALDLAFETPNIQRPLPSSSMSHLLQMAVENVYPPEVDLPSHFKQMVDDVNIANLPVLPQMKDSTSSNNLGPLFENMYLPMVDIPSALGGTDIISNNTYRNNTSSNNNNNNHTNHHFDLTRGTSFNSLNASLSPSSSYTNLLQQQQQQQQHLHQQQQQQENMHQQTPSPQQQQQQTQVSPVLTTSAASSTTKQEPERNSSLRSTTITPPPHADTTINTTATSIHNNNNNNNNNNNDNTNNDKDDDNDNDISDNGKKNKTNAEKESSPVASRKKSTATTYSKKKASSVPSKSARKGSTTSKKAKSELPMSVRGLASDRVTSHKAAEQRSRDKLRGSIHDLFLCVPSLQEVKNPSKATIIQKASEYLSEQTQSKERLEEEKKRLEEENLEMESKLKLSNIVTVEILDGSNRLVFVDHMWEIVMGYARSEVVGQMNSEILDCTTCPFMQTLVTKVKKSIGEGQEWTGINLCVRKDGRTIACETTVLPVMGMNGEVTQLVVKRKNFHMLNNSEREDMCVTGGQCSSLPDHQIEKMLQDSMMRH